MHSHDRTLLSSLGFSDPDKKNDRHNLACQYLALPENVERLLDVIIKKNIGNRECLDLCGDASLEVPISKGEGKYKTTIGFLDLSIEVGANFCGDMGWEGPWFNWDANMYVEVKIGVVSVSDVLRQIGLYREYLPTEYGERSYKETPTRVGWWVVATAYPMHPEDIATLRAANITHIRLGPKFDEWVAKRKERAALPAAESVEV